MKSLSLSRQEDNGKARKAVLQHQAVSSSLQSEQSMCVGVTVVE